MTKGLQAHWVGRQKYMVISFHRAGRGGRNMVTDKGVLSLA